MDSRFDYSVRIGYPLERANVNVVIVNLPDGDAEVVAETAEIFIYRIAIGLNLYLARWATDLTGWEGDLTLWKVENGEIVGRTAAGLKHNEFLKSQLAMEDFRLVLKIKLVPNKENSGVQFRSEKFGDYEMKGTQADAGAGWWGKLYEENGRALLWDKPGDSFVNLDDWNTYEILAIGSKIRTTLNGQVCADLDDPKVARSGIIGLQMHAGGPLEVRFKDFQLDLNPGKIVGNP